MMDKITIDGVTYSITPVTDGAKYTGATVTINGVVYALDMAQDVDSISADGKTHKIADSQARGTVGELQTSLANEIQRAESAEAALRQNIAAEAERAMTAEGINATSIATETARAQEAEKANADAIVAEASRAQGAESALQQNITAEAERAKEAEQTLDAKITTEEERATKAVDGNTLEFKASDNGVALGYKNINGEGKEIAIPSATTETAGAMSAEDKTKLDELQLEDIVMYGVEFDTTISSPACTRIGNSTLHRTLPIHSMMRGCLLSDDGSVVKYLNPSDWTNEVRDGSQGQVMVEIPEHWRRFETEGTKRRVKLSISPLVGYHKVPKCYVSAYEAVVDRTDTSMPKLSSVVNLTAEFRGGSNKAEWDSTSKSLLGRPTTQISRTSFREYARNRNMDSAAWNCMTYDMQKNLYWLFVVEYATLDSQASYTAELDANGYKKGGLGAGATTINSTLWGEFNNYNPFIPCGTTDLLGNNTGEMVYTMPTEYKPDTTVTIKIPRYRGVENPFGHIWQWADGINIRVNPTVENGGDDLSKVYVCSDPEKFTDSSYDGYSYIGDEIRANGYIKELIFGDGGEIIPSMIGGGSTTYHCDNHYTSLPTVSSLRGVLFGGSAYSGASAGLVDSSSAYAPSYTTAHFGSRLCFLPRDTSNILTV